MNKKQLKIVTGIAIAVLIVSIIPMLWISQYLHPFADDYVFGAEVYKIWNETHSFPACVQTCLECSYDDVSYMAGHLFRLLSHGSTTRSIWTILAWNIHLDFQFGNLYLHLIIYGYAKITPFV